MRPGSKIVQVVNNMNVHASFYNPNVTTGELAQWSSTCFICRRYWDQYPDFPITSIFYPILDGTPLPPPLVQK